MNFSKKITSLLNHETILTKVIEHVDDPGLSPITIAPIMQRRLMLVRSQYFQKYGYFFQNLWWISRFSWVPTDGSIHLVGNSERAAVCAPGIELNSGQFFLPLTGENNIPWNPRELHFACLYSVASRRSTTRRRNAALQYRQITPRTLCSRKHSQDTRFRAGSASIFPARNRSNLHPFQCSTFEWIPFPTNEIQLTSVQQTMVRSRYEIRSSR